MIVITELLRQHPEIALFAALSLGFFVGRRKVGNFSLDDRFVNSPPVPGRTVSHVA